LNLVLLKSARAWHIVAVETTLQKAKLPGKEGDESLLSANRRNRDFAKKPTLKGGKICSAAARGAGARGQAGE
jgi:hypothetical protein